MVNLEYNNIRAGRSDHSKNLVVRGEVINKGDKAIATVGLRIVIFVRNVSIASVVVLINGIPGGSTKVFEKDVEDLEFDAIGKDVTRFDVFVESAY